MKKLIIVIVMCCFIISIVGCSRDDAVKDKDSGTVTSDHSNVEIGEVNTIDNEEDTEDSEEDTVDSEEEIDFIAISEDLALQMANGEFGDTFQRFSETLKKKMSESYLKDVWNQVVADLGTYMEVYQSTEKKNENGTEVKVILNYENNGLLVSLVYNQSEELEGIWLNYSTIEEERASNDEFEEIDIQIGNGLYQVDGILTLPKDTEKPPVVIMVQGSGTHDMDETIGASANKPFRDIAWQLAEQGIASIRYNERYYQYPELGTVTTIEADLLDDAEAAINYVTVCDKIDEDRIYVLGHSLGGMMAPKIAFDHEEVKGIILLAGSPRNLEEIIVDQNRFVCDNTEGLTKDQISEAMDMVEKQANLIKELKETDQSTLLGFPSSYWYSLNQIDIPSIVTELYIPILIAQGNEDWQVYADKDYVAWQDLLGGKDNVTFHLYDNLNHLFMTTNGRTDITEYNIKGSVDQQVVEDIISWVKQ